MTVINTKGLTKKTNLGSLLFKTVIYSLNVPEVVTLLGEVNLSRTKKPPRGGCTNLGRMASVA